jgi:lipid-binding SYLF domain-containing protein
MRSVLSSSSRRSALIGAGAALLAGALAAPMPAQAQQRPKIDAEVQIAIDELRRLEPEVNQLFARAEAVLIIPEIIKAGFIVGGAYGEGALLKGGVTDSYWSYGAASIGYQIGAQTTRQAMFFMTRDALAQFEYDNGLEVGADAEITVLEAGAEVAVDTTRNTKPIIVIVYGREGLLGGVSLQGGKYSRLD